MKIYSTKKLILSGILGASILLISCPNPAWSIAEQCNHVEDFGADTPELITMYNFLEQNSKSSCAGCVDNRDGHIPGSAPSGGTYDKCIIAGTGNVCNPDEAGGDFTKKKCCDWQSDPRNTDSPTCACNTNIAGPCPTNNNACLCCMMLAEAQGESSAACKRAVGCVIKKRAGDGSICEANTKKYGDTPSFTSDKSICDKYADAEAGQVYNQTYRLCREAICNGGQGNGTYPGCSEMLQLMDGANCPNIDSFQVGPCRPGCTTVPIPSNPPCQHTFCRCSNPPPTATPAGTRAPVATAKPIGGIKKNVDSWDAGVTINSQ